VSDTAAQARAPIDCDVHCAPASREALFPYLSEYWREFIDGAGINLMGLASSYPPQARTSATETARGGSGPPVPATYDALKEHLLDPVPSRYTILNCLTVCEAHRNPYYQAALASALNDWLRTEWLERDDRLRASIVVSTVDAGDAVAEIERLADDRRFVQVLMPIRADAPYGNRRYHPIYEAAEKHGLVIGLHAWGRSGHAPTQNGFTLFYLEDYLSNPIVVQTHVLSLVSEGVFERFPNLRVSLLECGFAWLPPLLWRFDKDWKGVWREVPWVKDKPSEYVNRHFRATTAPSHLPTSSPRQVAELVEMVGPQWLMHASDYPHDHGPSAAALYAALDEEGPRAVRYENAAEQYRLAV
jgi:predicted TIM-barrel fold metal-dependent hydrolase